VGDPRDRSLQDGQRAFDLWQAARTIESDVARIKPLRVA